MNGKSLKRIKYDPRYETECEYIALLMNNEKLIKDSLIKPHYLSDERNQKLLEQIQECYKENQTIDAKKIYEKHKDIDLDYFIEIYTNTFYYETNIEKRKEEYEKTIVDAYKLDIQKKLYKEINENRITYQEFTNKTKKLDMIKVVGSEKSMLTIKDIDMSVDEQPERVKSNTATLDQYIKGFALGQLSVWSGGNASAKSTYLNQIAIESINQGYNTAIYSGELTAKRLMTWIIMQCAGKQNMTYNKTKDYWSVKPEAKQKILQWLDGKLYIYDNSKGNKGYEIINSLKKSIRENNVRVVILDNLMSMSLGDDNKYDMQSQFIQDLSNLAKEMNIHIHFVCHPRKALNFLRKTDISGTADLTNIADNVFIMHRTNQDFKIKTKEMFNWNDTNKIYEYSNVVEICKNRDFGVEDRFVGMQFETESKRLKDFKEEERKYEWEN